MGRDSAALAHPYTTLQRRSTNRASKAESKSSASDRETRVRTRGDSLNLTDAGHDNGSQTGHSLQKSNHQCDRPSRATKGCTSR
jgi:hypothetical protein